MSFVDLGDKLGVSDTAVRKRIKKLEDEGVIRKYTVDVDPKKLGFDINSLIGVDTTPEEYIHVIEKLKKWREILSLYSSTGDHMILMECWFESSEGLNDFVEKLEGIKGVTRVCPAMLIGKIK